MAPVWRVRLYVALVAVAGASAMAVSLPRVGLVQAVAFASVFLLAEATASSLRADVKVSLSNVVVLVALLHAGAPLAVVATLGAIPALLSQISRQRLLRSVFNVGQLAVSAAVGGLVYGVVTDALGASFPHAGAIGAVALAGLAYLLANHLLVAVVVVLAQGEPLRSTLASTGKAAWLQGPYVGIALLAAALLRIDPVGPVLLVLLALPVAVARSGLLAFQRVDEAYDRLVRAFVTAIEVKDPYTRGHAERVGTLAVHVAEELGMSYEERRLVGYAALLHDVGKIGVPGCVLNKPAPLDDDEFKQMARHPIVGAGMLRDIDFLAPVLDIVRYHHERLDGRGYPHGVSGDELSEFVRIVTCVDAFDAMTSTRSYRRAMEVEEAVRELERCAGQQFDPRMVAALVRVVRRLDWQPTVEFASEAELRGTTIPVGVPIRQRAELQSSGTMTGSGWRRDPDAWS